MSEHGNHESCCGSGSGGGDHHGGGHQNSCGCHEGGHHGGRRFYTKGEKKEHLEHYVEQLKKELAAVEERLKNM